MKIKQDIAVSDSGFVFNPATGESFSINPIGKEILNLTRENKSKEEIISILTAKYQTDADTAEKDMQDFFEMLKMYSLTIDDE